MECVSTHEVVTDHGPFRLYTYRDHIEHRLHLALVKGEIDPAAATLVRVHVQNPLNDVMGIRRDDFGLPLRVALAEVERVGAGVVLVLGGHEEDDALLRRIQEVPEPTVSRNGDNRRAQELRTYGIGAQIIADLGVRRMRVLSAPLRLSGLSGFGLEVVDYVEPGEVQP